jgi:hypothetical protein
MITVQEVEGLVPTVMVTYRRSASGGEPLQNTIYIFKRVAKRSGFDVGTILTSVGGSIRLTTFEFSKPGDISEGDMRELIKWLKFVDEDIFRRA